MMVEPLSPIRLALAKMRHELDEYGSGALRDFLCTVDITSYMIRKELAARDARAVDEACALKEKNHD